MKKIIIITSIAIVAIGATIWGLTSLKSNTISKQSDIYSSFPEVPVSILQINNLEELTTALLYNNNYWQDIKTINNLQVFDTILNIADSLKQDDINVSNILSNRKFIFSSYPNGDFLWSAQVSENEYDLIKEILTEQLSTKYYIAYSTDILLISDNTSIIEKSIKQISTGESLMNSEEGFLQIKNSAGDQSIANWFINLEAFKEQINNYFKDEYNIADISHYARWCGFDIEIDGDKLVVNGFSESGGDQDFLKIFANQENAYNTLTDRMPYNTYFFKHFSISDIDEYKQSLDSFYLKHEIEYNSYENLISLETNTGENPQLFFKQFFDGEIAYGRNPMNEFVIIKLFSAKEAAEKLNYMANDMDSRAQLIKKNGYDIYHFDQNGFAGCIFGKQFTLQEEYMTIVDNKLIIAPNINTLIYIASRKSNTQTLQCSPNFRDANKTLLSIANISIYVDIPYVIRNANSFFTEDFISLIQENENIWKNFSTLCFQTEGTPNENMYQHFFLQYDRISVQTSGEPSSLELSRVQPEITNEVSNVKSEELGVRSEELIAENQNKEEMIKEKGEITPNSICTPSWSVALDAPAIINPQIVKNHYNGENEIFIQDENNQIYLISNSGKILWKKSIDGTIIGNVHQVDMLKNNKLQMAFVTENKLYIVDRKGNNLKNYPKTLPQKAIVGLSVFDYDKNKNYRFFIPTKNSDILLFNMNGEVPSDWKYKGTANITTPIQYFSLKGKDYLITSDGKKAIVLNRRGENRVTPKGDTQGIKSQFFTDVLGSQDRFIAAGEDGKIIFIYTNNQILEEEIKKFEKNFDFIVYKGRMGNYYIYYDKNGFEAYDKDTKIYLRDNSISGGSNPTMLASGSKLATYDTKTSTWVLHNLVNYRKAYARYGASSSLGYFGTVKPYKGDCLITTDGNKVLLYK